MTTNNVTGDKWQVTGVSPRHPSLATSITSTNLFDLAALWPLERACFGPDAWGIVELGLTLLTSAVRLKMVEGERPIGFLLAERNFWGNEGLITVLGVHPDYQRRGLGRQLLAAAEAQLNTPRYKLTVRVSNAPAIALYEQCGYQRVSRVARYYARGEDGWVMQKTVDADTRG